MGDEEIDNILSKRIDNIPSGLFEWTNNINYPTHEEVRSKMINTYLNKTHSIQNELPIERSFRNNKRANTSQLSDFSKKEKSCDTHEEHIETNFDENENRKIDDKYYNEIINKNCYKIDEVNEKMIVVNQSTRNLINTILESTFNNIISEAIFSETDLSEQTKIFFYK
jgi:hypothetical protein